MDCCKKKDNLSNKGNEEISFGISDLERHFPSNCKLHLFSQTGKNLLQDGKEKQQNVFENENDIQALLNWKKSANSLATSIGEHVNKIPALHVKGSTHIFSVYTVDRFYLVALCSLEPEELLNFDTIELDMKLQKPIENLRLLLQDIVIPTTK